MTNPWGGVEMGQRTMRQHGLLSRSGMKWSCKACDAAYNLTELEALSWMGKIDTKMGVSQCRSPLVTSLESSRRT
eukprot:1368584-Rhodomonas_salina.1